jgi:hypothetical protein
LAKLKPSAGIGNQERHYLMSDPRITDNDVGEITATVGGKEIRGWSYKDDAERRIKMLMAHEFAEGYFQARHPINK